MPALTRGLRAAVAALALVMAGPAGAAEALDPSAVAQAYGALRSYCDEVALDERGQASTYRRCFTDDGRYKVHQRIDTYWANEKITWGDRARSLSWGGHDSHGLRGVVTDYYMEEPRRRPQHGGPPEGLFASVLNLFTLDAEDEAHALRALANYQADPGCDVPGLRCYRHTWTNRLSGTVVTQRLWLRSDGLVARTEERWNDTLHRDAVLRSATVNPPSAELDLAHTAPFLDRYSLAQRPAAFVALLACASLATGFVLWLLAGLRRARHATTTPARRWRAAWWLYLKVLLGTAALLGLLTLGSLGGGGHPPPIVFAWIIDIYSGLALLSLACLLAGAQLAELAARRLSGPRP